MMLERMALCSVCVSRVALQVEVKPYFPLFVTNASARGRRLPSAQEVIWAAAARTGVSDKKGKVRLYFHL